MEFQLSSSVTAPPLPPEMAYLSTHDVAEAMRLHDKDREFYSIDKLARMFHVTTVQMSSVLGAISFVPPAISKSNDWPKDRTENLHRLWKDGLSASEIGAEIGVSRSAVIGKLHRMGLTGGGHKPIKRPKYQPSVSMVALILESRRNAPGLKFAPPERKTVEPSKNLNIDDLTNNNCRWIYGTPGETAYNYCGLDVRKGSSYCETHHEVVYMRAGSLHVEEGE